MDAVSPKDAELTFVVAAKINKAAMALARASQRDLVNGSYASRIFVFKENDRLTGDGGRQTKICKLDDLAGNGLLREGSGGLGLWIHQTIEAEGMYPLK